MFERFYKDNSDFVFVRASGTLDGDMLKQHVIDFNKETEGRNALIELSDCRNVENVENLSVNELIDAAKLESGHQRAENGKLAIVVSDPLHYGLARAYGTISENSREEANVFFSMQEAIEWLEIDDPGILKFIEKHI